MKTPTLGIVCRRELESRDFVVQSYFEMVAAAAATATATATVAAGAFRMRHAPKERMTDRAKAEAVAVLAAGATGPLSVKVEDKIGRRRVCRTCRRCRSCARPASAGQLPIPWRWRRSCVTVPV